MSIYKVLDQVIDDYVGLNEEEINGYFVDVSADKPLRDCIVNECTLHINGTRKYSNLSDEAKVCIKEWEDQLKQSHINKHL